MEIPDEIAFVRASLTGSKILTVASGVSWGKDKIITQPGPFAPIRASSCTWFLSNSLHFDL